jgi:hypothetical protein
MENQKSRGAMWIFLGMVAIAAAIVWHSVADRFLPAPTVPPSFGPFRLFGGKMVDQEGVYVLDSRTGRLWFRSSEALYKLGGLQPHYLPAPPREIVPGFAPSPPPDSAYSDDDAVITAYPVIVRPKSEPTTSSPEK